MADRRYRQQGYRDSANVGKGKPEKPPVPSTPGMLKSRTVLRCVDCGTLLPSLTDLPGQCPKCGSDLHSCQQCAHFDSGLPFECSKPIPERIPDKRARNECTFFSLRKTVERDSSSGSLDPDDARRAFHNLFKK